MEHRIGILAVATSVALGMTAGGVLAAIGTVPPHRAAAAQAPFSGAGPYAVGEAVRTRLGVVRITDVEQLTGIAVEDPGSVNHGVATLVGPEQAQLQVTLRIHNDTHHPVTYSPSLIRLRVGGLAAATATSSTLPGGRLDAGRNIEGTLGFVAAQNGSVLQLELPGVVAPILIDLGRTDLGSVDLGSVDLGSVDLASINLG